MIKRYFQSAWRGLAQYPVIGIVNVLGTAVAIFLIMLVVMIQQVQVAPFAPESNRNRFLCARYISVGNEEWGDGTSNGPMSAASARELYKSLQTPEAVAVHTTWITPTPVGLPGRPSAEVDMRETDDDFWRVFDFAFTDGKPYDRAAFEAGLPVAVITESVARMLFGTARAAGQEFLLAHVPYRVCGVVRDVSTLAESSYGQLWIPYTSTNTVNDMEAGGLMGSLSCTILARSRADFPAIREECGRRLDAYNRQIGGDGWKIISRGRPYDQEKNVLSSANVEPDVWAARRGRWITFLILLVVPALNLSSMTQSRLRRRVSEIGVRRAFGSTRRELMGQILGENLIVTLLAGVAGLLFSVAFAYVIDASIFQPNFVITLNPPTVDASILIHASTFGWALLFCFVLNLLSTGIPAWKASRMNIVEAIGGRLH